MIEAVTLHNLYYLIDTRAWLDQRTGAHQSAYSTRLQDFVRCDVFDDYQPSMDVAARMRLWCAAHGYPVSDGAVIEHDDACLTKPVTLVLTTTTGMPRQALALVSIDGASPEVYADNTTDEGYWLAATTVQISCPAGHCWAWDGDRYLYAADGTETAVSQLFGRDVSVISPCRGCAAFDDGATEQMCPCSGYAVYCPACDRRCQVTLPDIPVFEEHP
ncbi:hypothetical protein Aca07nite_84430 [Actinoplanes capillaceus]|uniref:Uncharacterized protein n=1 Tax=Actinoplanes campanulatus TaxID=113559 RepID=A0ABQ3WYF3_9ACTN|nr:hypothetical protein [Actinoplanes capillaceus]GID51168.1 hypothetical protein Aca07nite_84430 [Actinoplanes capillaceus]